MKVQLRMILMRTLVQGQRTERPNEKQGQEKPYLDEKLFLRFRFDYLPSLRHPERFIPFAFPGLVFVSAVAE